MNFAERMQWRRRVLAHQEALRDETGGKYAPVHWWDAELVILALWLGRENERVGNYYLPHTQWIDGWECAWLDAGSYETEFGTGYSFEILLLGPWLTFNVIVDGTL